MNNIAVFIDLNKKGFSFSSFLNLLQNLENKGEIIYIKLYNFSSTKNKEYLPLVSKLDIETTPLSPELAKKRNRDILDIRQIVDIMEFINGETKINSLVGIFGEGNVVPVLKSIKMKNIQVISAFQLSDKANVNMVSENLMLSITQEEKPKEIKTKKTTKRKNTKKPTIKKKKSTVKPKQSTAIKKKATVKTTVAKTATTKKKAPTKKKVIKIVLEKEDLEPTTEVVLSQKNGTKKETTIKKPKMEEKIKEDLISQNVPQIKAEVVQTEEPKLKEEQPASQETPKENEEQFYISKLESFAKRTSALNFEFNEDIEDKRQLLKDIDTFVKEQKEIQYEKEDFNPEIMTVLRELGNLADDIRQTLDGDDDFDEDDEI